MIKFLCWNIRSINTFGALERLINLKKLHTLSMLAILEPFSNQAHIDSYRMHLLMDHSYSNPNNKIWLFWSNDISCDILESDQQQVTCEISHENCKEKFTMTYVYAKCKDQLRKPLWEVMLKRSESRNPWCVLGDFNVITSISEKLGGRDYNINKSLEFISIIEACGLIDMGYKGQNYTWCNHRRDGARIWKRLDRGLTNDKWIETMPHSSITHLPSVGSDHSPLLMEINDTQSNIIKYFKFLNYWTENTSFLTTVESCWNKEVTGNPMWILHSKLRRLTKTLRGWSKQEYGDVFEKVKYYEELVKQAEKDMICNNSTNNIEKLNAINAKYIKYLKFEYNILQQKTQLHWLKEGDANTKYFHALIRGKRNKMTINKLMDDSGNWIQGEEKIAKLACDYYEEIFTGKAVKINEEPLQCINNMISQEQNDALDRLPDED